MFKIKYKEEEKSDYSSVAVVCRLPVTLLRYSKNIYITEITHQIYIS